MRGCCCTRACKDRRGCVTVAANVEEKSLQASWTMPDRDDEETGRAIDVGVDSKLRGQI